MTRFHNKVGDRAETQELIIISPLHAAPVFVALFNLTSSHHATKLPSERKSKTEECWVLLLCREKSAPNLHESTVYLA